MKLSSYNIKCLVIYILYCLFFFFIGEGTFFDDDIKNYVFQYIGIPLITYLLLPFVLKLIGDWKIVRWIDGAIDYVSETGTWYLFHAKPDGVRTFVAFSSKLSVLTPKEIADMRNELCVVQLESGNYSLCKVLKTKDR